MSDRWDADEPPKKDGTEGVRIIGAEEAAEALERGDVAPRRGEGELGFGDRPASPPEGVRPAVRFPLTGDDDAPPRPRVTAGSGPSLPHWTEPPTGEVPRIRPVDASAEDDAIAEGDDTEAWSSFATSGPRWRDSAGDWAEPDYDPAAMRHDESTRVGALDSSDRPAADDFFSDSFVDEPAPVIRTGVRAAPAAPAAAGSDRDMPMAIGIGVGIAALFLLLLSVGPGPAMFLVTGVLILAAAELFSALQRGGYAPATLLGLVAVGSMSGAAYWKGETALPLVVALSVIFTLLWFLVGVTRVAPTMNAAVTAFGIVYVGLLGSYGALILRLPNGQGILLGVVVAVVANDVGALVVGRQAGRAPLAPNISPNKTIEGTIGGSLASILASFIVLGIIGVHPWDGGSALALGFVVALVAPAGDLCESMIKRDLGVKDMGAVLPGHGGLLDRFDALLFALPAAYYLCLYLDVF